MSFLRDPWQPRARKLAKTARCSCKLVRDDHQSNTFQTHEASQVHIEWHWLVQEKMRCEGQVRIIYVPSASVRLGSQLDIGQSRSQRSTLYIWLPWNHIHGQKPDDLTQHLRIKFRLAIGPIPEETLWISKASLGKYQGSSLTWHHVTQCVVYILISDFDVCVILRGYTQFWVLSNCNAHENESKEEMAWNFTQWWSSQMRNLHLFFGYLGCLHTFIQRICSHHGQTTVKWSHKVYCQVICQINRLCAWHLSHRPDSRPPIPWILITLTYIHLDTLPSTHDIFSTLKIFSSFMQQPWWRLLRVSLMQKGLGGWFYCRQRLTEAVRQKSQFL